jgi:hypothetical protein
MRRLPLIVLAACGGDQPTQPGADSATDTPPQMCEALPAMGQFTRRNGNPEIVAGATFTDGKLDVAFADPDLRFDATANRFELFYTAEHATAFGVAGTQVIRRATSPDRLAWTVDDAPALEPSTAIDAWDRATTEAPSVVVNPAAPADRRYLMMYAGSSQAFPHAGYAFPESRIGAAFSADGVTWTRVAAADSPHGQAGLVLTAQQIYPGAVGAIVDDPEVVLEDGIYHLFFSSFACMGADCATPIARGIGHATSADGITWTPAQSPVKSLLEASADDLTGGSSPAAIYDAVHCRWELWQHRDRGNDVASQPVQLESTAGVWHAESSDALQWSVFFAGQRDLAWNQAQPAAGEKLGLRTGFDVADFTGGRVMVYVGYDDANVPANAVLPTANATRAGVMTINIATRDVP